MSDVHTNNKAVISKLRNAMVDFDADNVRSALSQSLSDDAVVHMPYPFGDLTGPDELYDVCYAHYLMPCPIWSAGIGL